MEGSRAQPLRGLGQSPKVYFELDLLQTITYSGENTQVVLRNGDINEFLDYTIRKKLIYYGSAEGIQRFCEVFASCGIQTRVNFIAGRETGEGVVTLGGMEKPSGPLDRFFDLYPGSPDIVLLAENTKALNGIILENSFERLGNAAVYLGSFLAHNPPRYILPGYDPSRDRPLIPKTLHYCWFGGNPMPPLYKYCVETWKICCPDFEVIEWNEKNYDVTKNRYMNEAYRAGKWAFVTDYVRMDVIYRYGGVYLDADVELVKPLDRFLCDTGFCGLEDPSIIALGTAYGAVAGHEVIRALRDVYDGMSFIKEDGGLDLTPNQVNQTEIFRKLGLGNENAIQDIHGMTVYPTDVFSPRKPDLIVECFTENTHAIHHTGWSWVGDADKKLTYVKESRELLEQLYGGPLYGIPLIR